MTPNFLDSLEPLSESEVEVCQLSPMQEDFPLTRPRRVAAPGRIFALPPTVRFWPDSDHLGCCPG